MIFLHHRLLESMQAKAAAGEGGRRPAGEKGVAGEGGHPEEGAPTEDGGSCDSLGVGGGRYARGTHFEAGFARQLEERLHEFRRLHANSPRQTLAGAAFGVWQSNRPQCVRKG